MERSAKSTPFDSKSSPSNKLNNSKASHKKIVDQIMAISKFRLKNNAVTRDYQETYSTIILFKLHALQISLHHAINVN
jgi:hypothetical protein